MTNEPASPKLPRPSDDVPLPERTLRRLFLTLFLRGRGARGQQKATAAHSIAKRLGWTLSLYVLIGMLAFAFLGQPVFALSVYLHSMTFVFLGMFIASSAGEILFNKEEADILLHRPIGAKELLWAKIRVLVEVSIWLAAAFNLVGFFIGIRPGGLFFPPVHFLSTVLEAVFCTGFVVMAYELCLRWFGRERLDGLMTTTQVIISVGAVMAGQILPQLMVRLDEFGRVAEPPWWMVLLPPAWFAGIDDALVGSHSVRAWLLAATGMIGTAAVLWLAFGRLAGDYEAGLQRLNENVSRRRRGKGGRRLIERIIDVPPLRWWLRDPRERAAFLLTSAYLIRDRDVKLRVYPGIAPFLVMPFVFLLPSFSGQQGSFTFGLAVAGAYLGLVPLLGLTMLQYSQQWQAADIFRVAPLAGPAPLCHGARRAVMLLLAAPIAALLMLLAFFMQGNYSPLALLLPGLITTPVFALYPGFIGAVPLSQPGDEAKAATRGLSMIGVMLLSTMIAALAAAAWTIGFFWWLLLVEMLAVPIVFFILRWMMDQAQWKSLE